MKSHARGATRSFHRPLETYIKTLSDNRFVVDWLQELPDHPINKERPDNPDIPLFLALRARRI